MKVPDASRSLGAAGVFLPTWELDPERGPVSVFPDALDPRLVLHGVLRSTSASTPAAAVVYQLDATGMTQLTDEDGKPFAVGAGIGRDRRPAGRSAASRFERVDRYRRVRRAARPGEGAGRSCSPCSRLAGLVASLFVPRRRVWVRVGRPEAPGPDDGARSTVVEVAALARSEDPRLQRRSSRSPRSCANGSGQRPGPPQGAEEREVSVEHHAGPDEQRARLLLDDRVRRRPARLRRRPVRPRPRGGGRAAATAQDKVLVGAGAPAEVPGPGPAAAAGRDRRAGDRPRRRHRGRAHLARGRAAPASPC